MTYDDLMSLWYASFASIAAIAVWVSMPMCVPKRERREAGIFERGEHRREEEP